MIIRLIFFTAICWLQPSFLLASDQNVSPQKPALLPAPQSVQWKNEAIILNKVKLSIPALKGDKLRIAQLNHELKQLFQRNKLSHAADATQQIQLKLGKVDVPGQWKGQAREAYSLVAGKRGVVITANTLTGLYRGVQTLRQLVVSKGGTTTVASCKITDYPAFKIRGFMHDVGRNFQSIDQLKRQIDVMAAYKYNVFHWHLTDHFGWRLESKKYPGLQSAKAFGRHHGKFYTQKQFKELSDYCWARGIIIIPEFDSPGHSEAFLHGLGLKNMRDPEAKKAICDLIDEVCSLVDKNRMPYIHLGTDEVRHDTEHVNADYLPALHKAVQNNGREVIGWVKGMTIRGDKKQIQQTWAQAKPLGHLRHIDSRSNYVNHMEALDFAVRMFFQQPCRVPYGDEFNLGGILAHWPDTFVEDEKLILTNNPVIPAMVAYSEAVWKGIPRDLPEFWAKIPPKGTAEYKAFANFEDRLAEQRDRFLSHTPFPMVKTHDIEWRLLGPVASGEVPELEKGIIKDHYEIKEPSSGQADATQPGEAQATKKYNWTKPVHGGAIHVRHFFKFAGHLKTFKKGKDIVWANTHIFSNKNQELGAWISFNTTSSSDNRANVAQMGHWNGNQKCNIWINGKRIKPPAWRNPGKKGKEFAFTDEIYTSRKPTKIKLKEGWNSVLIKCSPSWKWVFSFSPVENNGSSYSEVEGLKYSSTTPK